MAMDLSLGWWLGHVPGSHDRSSRARFTVRCSLLNLRRERPLGSRKETSQERTVGEIGCDRVPRLEPRVDGEPEFPFKLAVLRKVV